MIIPVRCFCCNKVIGHLWQQYTILVRDGIVPNDALDTVGLKRYCCRRMFLGHVDVIDQTLQYSNNPGELPMPKYIPPENEARNHAVGIEYSIIDTHTGGGSGGGAEPEGPADDYVDPNDGIYDPVAIPTDDYDYEEINALIEDE